MKFLFTYSLRSECEVLRTTLAELDFIKQNNYEVWLPEGVSLDTLSSVSKKQVAAELNKPGMADLQVEIENQLSVHKSRIDKFIAQFASSSPASVSVILTQYGVGGYYELPNRIIINTRADYDSPFATLIHELVHLLIEEPIVSRYQLKPAVKEGLVDYLMTNDPHLHTIVPAYSPQKFAIKPSKQEVHTWLESI